MIDLPLALYQVKLTPDPQYIGNVLNPIFHSHSLLRPRLHLRPSSTLSFLPSKLLNVWFCFLFLTSAAALLFLIFIVYNDHPFATRRPRLDHVLLLCSACRLHRSILCTLQSSCCRSLISYVSLNKSSSLLLPLHDGHRKYSPTLFYF